jgi:type VI protein secretion system component VasF
MSGAEKDEFMKLSMENQRAITELLGGLAESGQENTKRPKKFRATSPGRIMVFACAVLGIVVAFYLFSWTMWREVPENILGYSKWLFGACATFFMALKGYQYGCDRRNGGDK